MMRGYWFLYQIAQNPKYIRYSRITGWSCQFLIFIYAWFANTYYLNDSVSFLTLAHNLQKYATFSQSYFPPITPDFQRTPAYPIFLMIFHPLLLLLLQQVLACWSQEYWAKALDVSGKKQSAHVFRLLIPWLPYPMLFASLLASESLYISGFAFLTYFFARFIFQNSFLSLIKATSLAILLTYLKPITLVLWISMLAYTALSRIRPIMIAFLLFFLGLSPWYIRNYNLTNHFLFSNLGGIAMHYGRTGALIENPKTDAERIAIADFLAGREAKKSYTNQIQTEENEFFEFSTIAIWIQSSLQHPIGFIYTQLKGAWGQFSGIAWKTAKMLTENYAIAAILAGIQLLFCVHNYVFIVLAWLTSKKNTWIRLLLFSGLCVFLAQNAVWADGRYRMILDPWALMIMLSLWERDKYLDGKIR